MEMPSGLLQERCPVFYFDIQKGFDKKSLYASVNMFHVCYDSNKRFLYTIMNATPKLQIAVSLNYSAQSINISDFI
jgi:hypothetical protein